MRRRMQWHLNEPWNLDPYPDARIYQNPSDRQTSVTDEPSFGWERT